MAVAAPVLQHHDVAAAAAVDEQWLAQNDAAKQDWGVGGRNLVIPGDDIPAVAYPDDSQAPEARGV